ncbi:hypothetical protein PG997_005787 [Apiospora hydei]|uniref:Uncharacterized protein n=1 Tax=Apiospora hydei TaxID=1337664 RepID=A0ABR1WQ02_9PEZI
MLNSLSQMILGMCYQIIELYSACRCLYYQHAVDKCASYGRPGHSVTRKTILVGYACAVHSAQSYGGSTAGYPAVTRPTLKQAVREIQRSERTIPPEETLAKGCGEKRSSPPSTRIDVGPESRDSSGAGFAGRASGKKTEATEKKAGHHDPGVSHQKKPGSAKAHANEAHAKLTLPLQEPFAEAKQDVGASEPYLEVLDDDGSSILSSLSGQQAESSETSLSASGSLSAVEFLTGGLIYDGILQYLWPQLFLRATSLEHAHHCITRFLFRFGLDLQNLAHNPSSLDVPDKFSSLKFRAGQFVEKRRRVVAKEICETFWLPDSHFEVLGQPPTAADILPYKTAEDDEDGSGQPELERLDVLKDFVFNTEPFFCFRQNFSPYPVIAGW